MNFDVKLPPAYCMKEGADDLKRTVKSLKTRSARYPLENLPSDLMWGKDEESIVELDLYKKGWAKLPNLFPSETLDKIQERVDFYLDQGGSDVKYGVLGQNCTLSQSEARDKELFMSVSNPLFRVPEIADVLFDERLIKIAMCYFKCMPAVGTLNLRKSFANDVEKATTTLFHCDNNTPYLLKFFLYLNDVEELDHGPFTYVEGSAYEKPSNWRDQHRIPDEEIERMYGKGRVQPLFAKKGDVLAAVTTGYHKGQKVKSQDRTMLTLNFVVSPEDWTAKTQFDIKPETCSKIPYQYAPLLDYLYITDEE